MQSQPDITTLDTVESVEHALAAADIEREAIETRIATLKTMKTRLTVHVPEDASSTPPHVVGSASDCTRQADVPEDASSTPPQVVGSESELSQAVAPPPKKDEPAPIMSETDQYIDPAYIQTAEQLIAQYTNEKSLNKDDFKAIVIETLGADEFDADGFEELWTTLETNGDGKIDNTEMSVFIRQCFVNSA